MHLPDRLTRDPWLLAASGLALALVLASTLALFGWFHPAFSLLALGFLSIGYILAFVALIETRARTRVVLLIGLALLATLIALRAEPTVFTGRDQGSIAIASLELAEGHELAFRSPASDAFFTVYGPGRALNFPGFSYTETGALITQFPIGYIAYLALFTQWFGTAGLLIANAVLFIFSSWTLFELLSLFVRKQHALFGTILFATSFILIWLTQITLTENLALSLFLALAFALVRLDQDSDARYLPFILIASFLLVLTRIEGFVIAPLALGYILYRPKLRAHLMALPKKWAIPTLLFLGFLFLRDLFMNLPFYTMIAKAGVKYWHELGANGNGSSEPSLGPVFFSYGLFPIFILGIAALLFGVMKRRFTLFIPVLLAAPTLIYLMNGHISDDHPWLLRRYAFTLFPLFLLATVVLVERLTDIIPEPWKKSFGVAVFSVLLLFQAWPSYQALSVVEYDTLSQQVSNFGASFSDRDLILIDRDSSGDPFAMLAGPLASLHEKNAAYFFNPEDYARLDRSYFDRVYLLATEDSLGRYAQTFGENLLPVEVISFSYPMLRAAMSFGWPEMTTVSSDAILFEVTP